ncbi:hypothetical protein EN741_22695 [Mesorhizobium sp. M4B.F.Ca.ET.019.03.1.1]|uniref:hypothetical protein n=1 Tax=Mesorhizobium sp. M4B.F.Ca.ET.019.03.1.1 TaxID=2496651 RepID=UPI000FC9EE8D|nr:hypothetical protein [Mesorhizobium sp. M4B.F.Ca.ET.019.03.1.1]RVD37729.1 hypothetical protein EN741_22695 [Mesorhizobium sp. M4B.F.Ca.ET.019.03.1.1]
MVDLESRREGDRIVILLDPGQPVELGDLSESFSALARMYGRHYRPHGETAPKLYVTKLETGSILMEIAPYVQMLGQAVQPIDTVVIVADFTNRLWRGIKAFSGGVSEPVRLEPPSDDDARDIREFVKPLLGKKGAELGIKHARYRKTDGEKETVVEYDFDESELNRAAINIDAALAEIPLAEVTNALPDHQIKREVMLFMDQANRGPGKEKGRTGDRGVIPSISDKALPVYFRKSSVIDLKGQITRDANPMTSTFVVDVQVQSIAGELKGYIVTEVHDAIPGDPAE